MTSRLLGAALVLLGSSWYGLTLAGALQGRVRLLAEIIDALQRLESEIVYRYAPLPEALDRVGTESRGLVRSLFLNLAHALRQPHSLHVSEAWRRAVQQWSGQTPLMSEDVLILESLGAMLGRTDVEDQGRYLKYTVQRLTKIWERIEESVAKESRLRIYLGVAGGVALAILLV